MSDLYATDASICCRVVKSAIIPEHQINGACGKCSTTGHPLPLTLWTLVEKLRSFTSALFTTTRGSLSSLEISGGVRRLNTAQNALQCTQIEKSTPALWLRQVS